MILAAWLVIVGAWIAPPLLTVRGKASLKSRSYRLIPLGLITQGAALALWGAAWHRALPYTWPKLVLIVGLSSATTSLALRWLANRGVSENRGPFTGRAALACLALALALTVDCLLIFGAQGWDFETGKLLHRGETYFRPPMNNDLFRHTVIVSSLARRSVSTPFLPDSTYTYQLFWHYLTASFTAPFSPPTNYPVVGASTCVVALLLFFLLLWGAHTWRPRLARSWGWGVPLFLLALGHGDVFHFLRSLLFEGATGIEADWSAPPALFRSFSVKLMALTAPQHALFFFFFLAFALRGPLLHGLVASSRRVIEASFVRFEPSCVTN